MLPFEDYSVHLIVGCSQSGKSTYVRRLCQHSKEMFVTPVDRIIYCYKHYEPEFTTLQSQVGDITFTPRVPSEEELTNSLQHSKHALIVVDDALEDIKDNPLCQALATRIAHHLKASVVFCSQTGQLPGKYGPTIAKNVHNAVVMNSPKENFYLRQLGIQLGQYQVLKQAYRDATKQGAYSYLCVCLHPLRCTDYRYCSSVFPGETTVIYKARDQAYT